KPVALKPKVVDTLLVLIENSGRVLEKDELIEKLWPDSFVEEGNLTQNIYELRKALNSGAEESYIETIPRRGYRFAGQVRELPLEEGGAVRTGRGESDPASENSEDARQQLEAAKREEPFALPAMASDASRPRLSGRWALICSVVLFGLMALISYYLLSARTKPTPANSVIKSLAVLPFKSLSAEAADEFMGQGMADALITKLSNSREIAIRPTSAVLRYSALDKDPVAAGRELGV